MERKPCFIVVTDYNDGRRHCIRENSIVMVDEYSASNTASITVQAGSEVMVIHVKEPYSEIIRFLGSFAYFAGA